MNENFFLNHNAIFSSGGILVDEKNNKVLIIRHSDRDKYLLPKGRIDRGESPKQTAQREIFEETGYENEVGELLRVQIRPDVKDKTKHKVIFWFYAKLTNEIQQEGTQMDNENFVHEWVTFDKAIEKLNWNDDKKMARIVKNLCT